AALSAGATDEGAPGPREEYGAPYYGCFVRDLDGHKIEAAYWDVALMQQLYGEVGSPSSDPDSPGCRPAAAAARCRTGAGNSAPPGVHASRGWTAPEAAGA